MFDEPEIKKLPDGAGITELAILVDAEPLNESYQQRLRRALGAEHSQIHIRQLKLLWPYFQKFIRYEGFKYRRLLEFFDELHFVKDGGLAWLDAIFSELALRVLQELCVMQFYDAALAFETELYARYVKSREGAAHFKKSIGLWEPHLKKSGLDFRNLATDIESEFQADHKYFICLNRNLPKVAFLVHQSSSLAHIKNLYNYLKAHSELPEPALSPVVVSLGGKSPEMVKAFSEIGVFVVELDAIFKHMTPTSKLSWVKVLFRCNKIDTVIVVSLIEYLAFAFAYRIAPVQIWWSMKYKGFYTDGVDGYLTQSHPDDVFVYDGVQWHGSELAANDWHNPEFSFEAEKIRQTLPYKSVFGTIGREEKLRSTEFLHAVTKVLKNNPDACFLWTGRHKDVVITDYLNDRGVGDRCYFIGWVNTRLYAQVIDVFLDSFPLGCGFTVLQTMASSTPVVFRAGDGIISYSDVVSRLMLKYAGDLDFSPEVFRQSVGMSDDDYIRIASEVADEEAIKSVGKVQRDAVRTLFSDTARAARVHSKQILNIRNKTLAQVSQHED